jgi:hypothetical protein
MHIAQGENFHVSDWMMMRAISERYPKRAIFFFYRVFSLLLLGFALEDFPGEEEHVEFEFLFSGFSAGVSIYLPNNLSGPKSLQFTSSLPREVPRRVLK